MQCSVYFNVSILKIDSGLCLCVHIGSPFLFKKKEQEHEIWKHYKKTICAIARSYRFNFMHKFVNKRTNFQYTTYYMKMK